MIILTSKLGVILISISVFLLIILLLVAILLYARSKLIPQKEVTLKINEDEYKIQPGGTILSTLSNQNIFLPK